MSSVWKGAVAAVARHEQPQLTPWFSGDVQPVRPGVYLREWPHRALYAEWTGHQWMRSASTVRAATRQREVSMSLWGIRWRGLAADPKAGT